MLARRGGKSESSSAGMTSPSDGPRALLAGAEQKSLVADHLRSSDYLSNIHALRKRLEKEHASLDVKLKSGAKDQLEATRDGLLNLQITRKDVSSIQEAFGQVEQLCGSSSGRSSAATRSFKVISEFNSKAEKLLLVNVVERSADVSDERGTCYSRHSKYHDPAAIAREDRVEHPVSREHQFPSQNQHQQQQGIRPGTHSIFTLLPPTSEEDRVVHCGG
ncbi:unnamed protein product [Tilletia controversa]|nr:unnamed protein product [Tilletia controversa]